MMDWGEKEWSDSWVSRTNCESRGGFTANIEEAGTNVSWNKMSINHLTLRLYDSREIDWGGVVDPQGFIDDCHQIGQVLRGCNVDVFVGFEVGANLMGKLLQGLRVSGKKVSSSGEGHCRKLTSCDNDSQPVCVQLFPRDAFFLLLVDIANHGSYEIRPLRA